MEIGAVPLAHLARAWPALWPMLAPALRRSPDLPAPNGPAACVDAERWLLGRLRAHDAQLWAVYADGRPIAAVVTAVQDVGGQLQGQRRCLLWLIGGHRAREWADAFLALVESWARPLGCIALWGSGRRGWARIVEPRGFRRITDLNGQPAWERRIA
jgi:hypothetical protein